MRMRTVGMLLGLASWLLSGTACVTQPSEERAPELPSFLSDRAVTTSEEALEARAYAMGFFRKAYEERYREARRENFDLALYLYRKAQRFYLEKLEQVRTIPLDKRNKADEAYYEKEVGALDLYIDWILRDRPVDRQMAKEVLREHEEEQALYEPR